MHALARYVGGIMEDDDSDLSERVASVAAVLGGALDQGELGACPETRASASARKQAMVRSVEREADRIERASSLTPLPPALFRPWLCRRPGGALAAARGECRRERRGFAPRSGSARESGGGGAASSRFGGHGRRGGRAPLPLPSGPLPHRYALRMKGVLVLGRRLAATAEAAARESRPHAGKKKKVAPRRPLAQRAVPLRSVRASLPVHRFRGGVCLADYIRRSAPPRKPAKPRRSPRKKRSSGQRSWRRTARRTTG